MENSIKEEEEKVSRKHMENLNCRNKGALIGVLFKQLKATRNCKSIFVINGFFSFQKLTLIELHDCREPDRQQSQLKSKYNFLSRFVHKPNYSFDENEMKPISSCYE